MNLNEQYTIKNHNTIRNGSYSRLVKAPRKSHRFFYVSIIFDFAVSHHQMQGLSRLIESCIRINHDNNSLFLNRIIMFHVIWPQKLHFLLELQFCYNIFTDIVFYHFFIVFLKILSIFLLLF